ncbi:tetratricopeptide repeat protein [Arsukibacterium perlucidum]|uniref:tetratricopeptide repeat protein n=1 Tax=Arsukibacterium perlucidum TaxID=368811 RepID=UPI000378056A|nr:tetratricopeptide repeat protein [Arsukibacterium perlucidum]
MKITKTGLALAFSSTLLFTAVAVAADTDQAGFCESASCQSEFNKLEEMARYGSGEAATIVALAYATGEGVEQDIDKARLLIKQAVRWREPMGMHQMSIWLRQGFIFEQDIARADELLSRAARAEFGPALTDKAKLLLTKNTPQADKKAIALLEQADQQYYSPGQYLLAQLLVSGVAVESDLARAARLYKNLALKGYADSRQQLDQIITALEQTTERAAEDKADSELVARVQPLLTDLKQINDIEVFQIQGEQFNVKSEFSNIVAQLDSLQLYERNPTGTRIPGQLCGRGVASCTTSVDDTMGGLLDRSSVFAPLNFRPTN